MRRPYAEGGFALISAVWLLALGSAIVALLLLRAQSSAREVRGSEQRLIEAAALASAADTIAAELLLLGARSRWARLPAQGSLEVDGTVIEVLLSSEEGRIDVNAVSLDDLDATLRELKVNAAKRRGLLLRIEERRASKRPFRTLDDMHAWLDGTTDPDSFTIYSGLTQPQREQMPTALSRGVPRSTSNPGSPIAAPLGTPLRMVARAPDGGRLVAVLRVTPGTTQPLLIHSWQRQP